jgi:hypothetical protein
MQIVGRPSRRNESRHEAAAKSLVESVLSNARGTPVTLEFWDDGTRGDGQHDYWIGPARWGALESPRLLIRSKRMHTGWGPSMA